MAPKKKYGSRSRTLPTGSRPMPSVVQDNEKVDTWPLPENSSEFPIQYVEASELKQFHVDYLIDKFKDFARPNLYKVEFYYDERFLMKNDFLSEDNRTCTEMMARTINIPAYDIGKQEIRRCGARMFLPTNQNYGDIQMTMMCDDNYTQRKFLHAWMKRIVYDTDYNHYHKVNTLMKSKVIIKQFDNKFNTVFAAELGGAWPFSIGEVQLSQDSDAQIVDFPVNFCYSSYKILSNSAD